MTSNAQFNTGIGINQILDRVQEDPNLAAEEKGTHIYFAKPEDVAHIYTEERGITRRLLRHPHFDLEEWRVVDGDVWGKRIGANNYNGEIVTGVQGYVPTGCIKIQSSPRSTSWHSRVVSRGNGRNVDWTP